MTKPNSTDIIIVLDRSGSMSSIASDMEGGFDAFIKEQKALPGECHLTLTQFDDQYEVVYERKALRDVPKLSLTPRGSTALLDAIGRTIDATGKRLSALPEADRPSKVVFVVITDGFENASREYNTLRVVEMIKTQREKYAWEFVFMGASENAISVAQGLGIQAQNAVHYVAQSGLHAQGVFRGISSNIGSYRQDQGLGNLQASYNAATNQSGSSNTPDPANLPKKP